MTKPAYKDASYSTEERVNDLLGIMTIEEKVAQTMSIDTTTLLITYY